MGAGGPDTARGAGQREALLDAGLALLGEVAQDVLLRALTVRAVAGRTGRSTGAFYHYWGTQEEYLHDLIGHLLRPEHLVDADPITDELARLDGPELDAARIAELFTTYTLRLADDPGMRIMLLLWSMPDADGRVRAAMREVYRLYQRESAGAFRRILAATGAELVAGITFEDLAAMMAGIADGVAVRRRVDPDGVTAEAVRAMVHALMASVLVPRGDGRSVDDLAATIDAVLRGGGAAT